jgi:hypothetical protein
MLCLFVRRQPHGDDLFGSQALLTRLALLELHLMQLR